MRASQPGRALFYVAGLLVLMAGLLVRQSPFYGFHAVAGYVHSFGFLQGRLALGDASSCPR